LCALKGKRVLDNAPDELVNGLREFVPEPRPALFVPGPYFQQFVFGLRPEDNTPCHVLPQQLPAHIGPRNGRTRVRQVLSPAPIEFSPQFVRDLERFVAFTFRKALPERHCESGAVLGRELEKVRKWAGCHVWILSRVRHECNAAKVPPPLWPRSDDPDHP
jgi:hypothetical protein